MPRTYNEADALISKEGRLLKKITIQIEGKQDKMVYSVTDIKAIPQDVCNALKVGDIVNKGNHSYRVSFKKSDEGMCLTYVDASRVETQSYDLIGDVWTYNSEDLTEFEDFAKETDLPPTVVANPTLAGTEDPLTGLQIGNTKYAMPQGGEKLYNHIFNVTDNTYKTVLNFSIINKNNETQKMFYNTSTLGAWLYNNGYTSKTNAYPCSGIMNALNDDVLTATIFTSLFCDVPNGFAKYAGDIIVYNTTNNVVTFETKDTYLYGTIYETVKEI